MMYPFLQPTEGDKVLNEKVMGSCKQVGAFEVFCVLLKYPKCFTETNRVKLHYYVAITKFKSLLLIMSR